MEFQGCNSYKTRSDCLKWKDDPHRCRYDSKKGCYKARAYKRQRSPSVKPSKKTPSPPKPTKKRSPSVKPEKKKVKPTVKKNKSPPLNIIEKDTGYDVKVTIPTKYKGVEKRAELEFYDGFFDAQESKEYYDQILKETDWDQMYEYSRYSGIQKNARVMKWYSDLPEAVYAFSSNSYGGVSVKSGEFNEGGLKPNKFTTLLKKIRRKLMYHINSQRQKEGKSILDEDYFNSLLVNYYENGSDAVAWHADKDPWLGTDFMVPSITFGAERPFYVKPNDEDTVSSFKLKSGSLLFMKGMTQEAFQHHVPKLKKSHEQYKYGRINLTFRRVKTSLINTNPRGFTLVEFKKAIMNWFKYTEVTAEEKAAIVEARSPAEVYPLILRMNKKRVSQSAHEKKSKKSK